MAFNMKDYKKKWCAENRDKITGYRKKYNKKCQSDLELFASNLLSTSKSGAKERGLVHKIKLEDVKQLILQSKGKCAISGLDLSTRKNCNMKASLDRIDSNKGYIKGNVQLVASIVNKSKNILTTKDYLALCKAILKKNGYSVRKVS